MEVNIIMRDTDKRLNIYLGFFFYQTARVRTLWGFCRRIKDFVIKQKFDCYK